jgi:hypothetical protein
MKLWSGTASIAPKNLLHSTFAVAAALGMSPFALAQSSNVPHAKTVSALLCLLGMAPKACTAVFIGGATLLSNQILIPWSGGHNPYFRTAKYVGTNNSGEDVWDVKFMHSESTYVIAPPDPDGKIRQIAVLGGPPDRLCYSIVGDLASSSRMTGSCHVLFRSS